MNLADIQVRKEAEALRLKQERDNALQAYAILLRGVADLAREGNVGCRVLLRRVWKLLPGGGR